MLTKPVEQFKALAHPARLRILAMLRPGSLCVCQIVEPLALAPSTVSAHLAELRRAGLIEESKQGRWVHYRLSQDSKTARVLRWVWRELETDPQIAADADLVAKLREIPLTELCRTGVRPRPRRVGVAGSLSKKAATRKRKRP